MTRSLIDSVLDYCWQHPIPDVDVDRFLRHLSTLPDALVDLREHGLLGVILDRAKNADGARPFEWIGASIKQINPALCRLACQEMFKKARALDITMLDLPVVALWQPVLPELRALGARESYIDWEMEHPDGDWGEDAPVSDGWRWKHVTPDLDETYVRLLRRAFSGIPGLYLMSDAEMGRALDESRDGARLLFDEAGEARALVRCRIAKRYIHAIARDPNLRGQQLGRLAMDEARRILGKGGLRLTVVAQNKTAVDLYRRLGFVIVEENATITLPVGQLSDLI